MARYVKFTEPDARRIAKTVRDHENQKGYGLIERLAQAASTRVPSPMFAVRVYIDGGAPGTPSSACTWTYRVTTMSGRELGAGLSPLKRRYIPAIYDATPAGSVGSAFFDDKGELRLFDANELLATVVC